MINSAAMNTGVHVSFQIGVLSFLDKTKIQLPDINQELNC